MASAAGMSAFQISKLFPPALCCALFFSLHSSFVSSPFSSPCLCRSSHLSSRCPSSLRCGSASPGALKRKNIAAKEVDRGVFRPDIGVTFLFDFVNFTLAIEVRSLHDCASHELCLLLDIVFFASPARVLSLIPPLSLSLTPKLHGVFQSEDGSVEMIPLNEIEARPGKRDSVARCEILDKTKNPPYVSVFRTNPHTQFLSAGLCHRPPIHNAPQSRFRHCGS